MFSMEEEKGSREILGQNEGESVGLARDWLKLKNDVVETKTP